MKTNVFISGGGISGLLLGLILARSSIDVIVAEKDPKPSVKYKGELLQPKSLEMMNQLGLYEEVSASGFPIHTTSITEYDRDRVMKKIEYRYDVINHQFNKALMVPHEELKDIIRKRAEQYSHFHFLNPAKFTGFQEAADIKKTALVAHKEQGDLEIQADFFVGAEGRISPIRNSLGITLKETEYNHYFLTVTFPRPAHLTEGEMLVRGHYFLGLFPLPNSKVRTVLLIKKEEYKEMKRAGLESFYRCYTSLKPELDGYVQEITTWKDIQLMVPTRHNADRYIKGNCALIGDAVHTVHPMAGEGMNLAIQDACTLGEMLSHMYKDSNLDTGQLTEYERVRKPRAEFLSSLSHLSALAYSYWQGPWPNIRSHVLKRIEHVPTLHYKHMLNISGLGMWKDTLLDRFVQIGLLPGRILPKVNGTEHQYKKHDDYPWINEEEWK
ncbi:FAD-dependent oxidoreductase [Domibacillus indicus]|uniref:FAD-dependent oxidoreductase n=1 Tax=Domibacillus indicus TaxID=1437523 RepID=UPI0006180FBE|nr:FAD-dependent monooxygenase [Domibacillus indicus]